MSAALADTTNKINAETEKVETIEKPAVAEEPKTTEATETNDSKMNEAETVVIREERVKNLKDQLAIGKRLIITNDFVKASNVFSQVLEQAVELYGPFGEETYEPYFFYGQSLFEVGKIEDQVFSNAMTNIPEENEEDKGDNTIDEEMYGNPENLSDEERENIKQKVEEALMEQEETTQVDGEAKEEVKVEGSTEEAKPEDEAKTEGEDKEVKAEDEAKEEQKDEDETKKEVKGENENKEEKTETETTNDDEKKTEESVENEKTEMETETETDEKMESTEENKEDENVEEEEEDVATSMQRAWEVVECARRVCEKMIESLKDDDNVKTWLLKKADVHNLLGEIQTADCKLEEAQAEFSSALEINMKYMEPNSREIAQCYYLLGKAFRLDGKFNEATENFQKAKELISAKHEELKKLVETTDGDEKKKELEDEIKEIVELLPAIDDFILDAKESAVQSEEMKEALKKEFLSAATTLNNLGGDKKEETAEANDISNLIRRPAKRPASSEPNEEEAVKKGKTADTSETVTTTETSEQSNDMETDNKEDAAETA